MRPKETPQDSELAELLKAIDFLELPADTAPEELAAARTLATCPAASTYQTTEVEQCFEAYVKGTLARQCSVPICGNPYPKSETFRYWWLQGYAGVANLPAESLKAGN